MNDSAIVELCEFCTSKATRFTYRDETPVCDRCDEELCCACEERPAEQETEWGLVCWSCIESRADMMHDCMKDND